MAYENLSKQLRYEVYTGKEKIEIRIKSLLKNFPEYLALDVETRSVYDKDTRKEAEEYLKIATPSDPGYKEAMVVAHSSGLSFPKITRTTHFILGISPTKSYIFVCLTEEEEEMMWKHIATYTGTFLIHNSLFDLKIMYHKMGSLPVKFIDTELYAKCFINHVNTWKCKTGLKELMGEYYSPEWSMYEDYEPEDLFDEKMLKYAATDGAAVMYLWEMLQDMANEERMEMSEE